MSAPNITSPSRHGTQVCRRVAGPRAGASVPWLRRRAPPLCAPLELTDVARPEPRSR
ncbi:hypothetical protein CCHR01_08762 [Colletotrichum chrysophilum]|uniref:Uncharacterized protein n=1 Tax=Colletotrichum chrysophilum TaxID=1836956 RepID=A0AAD9AJ07_9PEZI|nr:hypothetical protein CCHR01_08762 [Colletotrichum chrysophilum]